MQTHFKVLVWLLMLTVAAGCQAISPTQQQQVAERGGTEGIVFARRIEMLARYAKYRIVGIQLGEYPGDQLFGADWLE